MNHEVWDHAVELAGFVALGFAEGGFVGAGAELEEVFGCFGDDGAEKLEFYAAERFAYQGGGVEVSACR